MLNIEIKARTTQSETIKSTLAALNADFKGIDHQIDTYFNVPDGRLKLRQGHIENNLIFYQRPNQAGPKASDFHLYPPTQPELLKTVLTKSLGEKVVVDKLRAIYYIDNVKFHVDEVKGLGSFVEIEVFDANDTRDIDTLQQQCEHYMKLFGIDEGDLLEGSYSDLMLE